MLTSLLLPTGAAPPPPPPPVGPHQDVLDRGLAWLTGQLNRHVSAPVSYRRGAAAVEVLATPGRTLLRLDDGYGGLRMEWTDRDFLIPAAALVLSGATTLPRRGDRIEETREGATRTYEVLAPGEEPAWKWADPYRRMLRVHTKLVDGGP